MNPLKSLFFALTALAILLSACGPAPSVKPSSCSRISPSSRERRVPAESRTVFAVKSDRDRARPS